MQYSVDVILLTHKPDSRVKELIKAVEEQTYPIRKMIIMNTARFENVAKLPEFQNEYAQGNYGEYNVKSLNGWGPNIAKAAADGMQYNNYKGPPSITATQLFVVPKSIPNALLANITTPFLFFIKVLFV